MFTHLAEQGDGRAGPVQQDGLAPGQRQLGKSLKGRAGWEEHAGTAHSRRARPAPQQAKQPARQQGGLSQKVCDPVPA